MQEKIQSRTLCSSPNWAGKLKFGKTLAGEDVKGMKAGGKLWECVVERRP